MLSLLLDAARDESPHKTALVSANEAYTYDDLWSITQRLAAAFLRRGVRPGDRVAFLLSNCLEIVACYYACFKVGAVAVPLNIRFGPELLRYTLNHSGARILISEPERFTPVAAIRASLTGVEQYYLLSCHSEFEGTASFDELLSGASSGVQDPGLDEISPAAIYYTSGTTGRPKGVVHTHGSLGRATKNQIEEIRISADDKTLILLPVCYLIGFGSQVLPFLSRGASCVLLPYFEPELALRAIETHQPTKIYGFPTLYQALVSYPNASRYNLRSLNFCFSAGEAIPVAIQQQFRQTFGLEITEGCGMTELQIYSMNPPYDQKKAGSIGR
ncbi:MAG: AMP-binding protein, partial [Verrucomicrobia bacterium]|nr:AMP-binding protein [Verrucomicrobiota bacterium]